MAREYGTYPQIVFGQTVSTVDKDKCKDTQAGESVCRWDGFHGEDIKDEDLPSCKLMGGTDNHNLSGYGGNHFGLIGKNDPHNPTGDNGDSGGQSGGGGQSDGDSRGKRGTPVVGIALGPQHFMVIGTMGSHGHGDTDSQANIDSDTPTAAKDKDYKGPQKGDMNPKADKQSVLEYADKRGGPGKNAAEFSGFKHSVGLIPPLET